MAVHAIRVETSEISNGVPLDTVIDNYLSGRTRTLQEQEQAFTLTEPTPTEPLNEAYRHGLWRFPGDPTDATERANLLDPLENALSSPAVWARIRYQICYHDEADPGPCMWEDVEPARVIGTPPAELPPV